MIIGLDNFAVNLHCKDNEMKASGRDDAGASTLQLDHTWPAVSGLTHVQVS